MSAGVRKTTVERDLILLLAVGGLFSLSTALSNTFVNVFLWKQSNGEFLLIAIYNLASVMLQLLTFIVAGRLAKKIDRIVVLRIGIIFLSIFFFTVLLTRNVTEETYWLLGILIGIGLGFYWLAFNVLTFEITEPETRDFFNGYFGLLNSFSGMAGPVAAGLVITKMKNMAGYYTIFSISLSLFVLAMIVSFFLQKRKAFGPYHFFTVVAERKRNKNWGRILYAHFFQGIREGTFSFMIVLLLFIDTNSELSVGIYGFVASLTSFLFYYLATKFIRPHLRKKAILIGGIILYLSLFLIAFEASFPRFLLYGFLISIAYPILLVPYDSLTYDVIGKARKVVQMRIEYIVVREVFLNFGRIVSILCFILAFLFYQGEYTIPALLLILGSGHSLIYFFISRIEVHIE